MDLIIIFLAKYFGYILLAVFLVLFFQNRDPEGVASRPYGAGKYFLIVPLVSAVVSRFVFTEIIRFFYFRPRPFVEQGIDSLFEHAQTSSFPSGHAAFFFALSAGVYSFNKKAGYWFFAASAAISLARVIAGVHYFTDVLGGLAVGVFSFRLVSFLYKKFK